MPFPLRKLRRNDVLDRIVGLPDSASETFRASRSQSAACSAGGFIDLKSILLL